MRVGRKVAWSGAVRVHGHDGAVCGTLPYMRASSAARSLRVVSTAPPATVVDGPPAEPTHLETIEDLLAQSGRGMAPIRKSFVQRPRESADRVGPLAAFVKSHDERGLDFYLFIHALASKEPWTCVYPSRTWVRVLDLASTCETASATAGVSKALKRLEGRHLIIREGRQQRQSVVRLLAEDGSGADYSRPLTVADGPWLNLPYSYWRHGHHVALNLPGKAMLLVALSLPDTFVLPQERMPAWYGWSKDTAGTGLQELRDLGVLSTRRDFVRDHKSPTGWREEQHHQLIGDYSPEARRRAAAERRSRRSGKSRSVEAAVS